jgi:hypothetical protein
MTCVLGRPPSPSGFNRPARLNVLSRRRPAIPLLITCDEACYLPTRPRAARPARGPDELTEHAAITHTPTGDRCTLGPPVPRACRDGLGTVAQGTAQVPVTVPVPVPEAVAAAVLVGAAVPVVASEVLAVAREPGPGRNWWGRWNRRRLQHSGRPRISQCTTQCWLSGGPDVRQACRCCRPGTWSSGAPRAPAAKPRRW